MGSNTKSGVTPFLHEATWSASLCIDCIQDEATVQENGAEEPYQQTVGIHRRRFRVKPWCQMVQAAVRSTSTMPAFWHFSTLLRCCL